MINLSKSRNIFGGSISIEINETKHSEKKDPLPTAASKRCPERPIKIPYIMSPPQYIQRVTAKSSRNKTAT